MLPLTSVYCTGEECTHTNLSSVVIKTDGNFNVVDL